MKRGIWLACCAGTALLSACAALWPAPVPAEASKASAQPPRAAAQLAQLGHGRSAAFALCDGAACPKVTPKTFATDDSTPAPDAAASRPDAPRSDAAAPRPATEPLPEAGDFSVTVHFRFGEAVLTPLAKAVLDAAALRAGAARRLRIEGRTDSAGAQAVNDALAKERARAVRDHLRTRLPNWPATVDTESAGACCFAASNATAHGRQANRRVEVTFSSAQPEDLL